MQVRHKRHSSPTLLGNWHKPKKKEKSFYVKALQQRVQQRFMLADGKDVAV